MGDRRAAYRVLVERPEGKRPRLKWEDNIKWILMKLDGKAWTGLFWLSIGTGSGCL